MKMTVRGLLALGLAALALPVQAQTLASPAGIWEIEMRDSRYQLDMCGGAGDQICGTLIWLGNGADSPENLPYLNTLMIDHAPPIGQNRWRGTLHIYGQTATGTITQVSDDQMLLQGCAYLVICKTYKMYRYAQ